MMHLNVNILAEVGAIASVGIINTIPCSEWRLQKVYKQLEQLPRKDKTG
ncbi:MAG: hypothetical protein ACYTXC_06660 [Nostoc sp.]